MDHLLVPSRKGIAETAYITVLLYMEASYITKQSSANNPMVGY